MPDVGGFVAPGFEGVAREFERNFAERSDLGAAFAAVRDGEPVVDLWGGVADAASGRVWEADTASVIFSGTKALVALCLLILIDRGLLAPDVEVARHWPEFAAHGKDRTTVAELVSHRARLPGLAVQVTVEQIADAGRMAALLAAQAPSLDARAAFIYHPLAWGWLAGELVRRIDGRSVGAFFREEVAGPLGLDVWIGLPAEPEPQLSVLRQADDWARFAWTPADFAADTLLACTWGNPDVFGAGVPCWNRRELQAAEIPGAGGIAVARSMARLYGHLARGGGPVLSPAAAALATRCLVRAHEPLIDKQMAFGFGLQLQSHLRHLGPSPDAFGHSGVGGTVHGAWPGLRTGWSYCTNLMRNDEPVDPRPAVLLEALHASLSRGH